MRHCVVHGAPFHLTVQWQLITPRPCVCAYCNVRYLQANRHAHASACTSAILFGLFLEIHLSGT
ncbi:uncharacterized protein V6R79_009950 [Siganus canaliculatus]